MERPTRDLLWVPVFAVLIVFAVPWFLWGTGTIVAGLPVWLWWHIGWMGLAAVLFHRFTKGAWDRGMGLDPDDGPRIASTRGDDGDRE